MFTLLGFYKHKKLHEGGLILMCDRFSCRKALRHSHVMGLVYGLSQSLLYFAYAAVMYYGGLLIRDENVEYTKIFM